MLLEEFLKRYQKLRPPPAGAAPAEPPALPGIDYQELHRLIQSAVRSALQEHPHEPNAPLPPDAEAGRRLVSGD